MGRGGKRLGSGRKKGSKDPQTLEREKVMEALRRRIMQSADHLFNAAKSTAIGNQYLWKITTITEGKRKVRSKPELVTDPQEISSFIDCLDRENRGEQVKKDEDVYYFISTKEPNVQAVKELFDRAFGKPKETIEHSGPEGKEIPILQILSKKQHEKG